MFPLVSIFLTLGLLSRAISKLLYILDYYNGLIFNVRQLK
jgi:hypothetical protein